MDLSLPRLPAAPVAPPAGNDIDRRIRAGLGRATGSLSVGSALLAAGDEWLRAHSGDPVKPPRVGVPGERVLDDAPGRYVLEK
jgi:hypothetical protein